MKRLIACSFFLFTSAFADYASSCPDYCNPVCDDWTLFVHRRQVFVNAEFLYWTVQEGALDFALKMRQPAFGPTPAFATGSYKIGKYDWRPGMRVSIGWYNEPKYWEVLAQYTWLYDKGVNHAHKPKEEDLFLNSTWGIMTSPPLESATSHLGFHYHVGDALVARVFDPNPHFRFRLVGGITTAYIKQKWRIAYDNGIDHDLLKNQWRYWAAGLRLGMTLDWFWTSHIYFSGKTSIATLLGGYKNIAVQTTTANPGGVNNPSLPIRHPRYHDHRFAFHVQFLLGPSWQQIFDCWAFELFAGYEFNLWLNLQEVFRSTQSGPSFPKETWMANGLLGLQGLTARLTIGF
jgi:hypothetical protein